MAQIGSVDAAATADSQGTLFTRVAQGCLLIAAVAGLALAWVMFDWIGRFDNHCDFPEDCLNRWLPRAFSVAQYLWVVAVVFAGVGVVAAALARWRRRDILALGMAWVAMCVAAGITPMYGTGEPMSLLQAYGNPFLMTAFPWYGLLAVTVLAASLTLAAEAFRWRPA